MGESYAGWAAGQVAGGRVRWPDRRGGADPTTRRYSVDGGGHGVGGPLVVDPPADEVRPCVGRLTLDREVHLAHPGDRREELLIAQADAAVGVGFLGDLKAHCPGRSG
jgi:hypothetical protein